MTDGNFLIGSQAIKTIAIKAMDLPDAAAVADYVGGIVEGLIAEWQRRDPNGPERASAAVDLLLEALSIEAAAERRRRHVREVRAGCAERRVLEGWTVPLEQLARPN